MEKTTIASILLSKAGISFFSKQIKSKFKSKFDEKVVVDAVRRMISEPVNLEEVKIFRAPSVKGKKKVKIEINPSAMVDPAVTMSTNN